MRILLIALAVLSAAPVAAQTYPTKPIKLVVPFTPGGSQDVIARLVAQKMGDTLKQQLIIENRAGAGGQIAAEAVAKSAPDGYTLFLASAGAMAIEPALRKVPYDPVKDFVPVVHLIDAPMTLIVGPGVKETGFKELLAAIKAQPGKLSYGSTGSGTVSHLTMEALKQSAGLDIEHVPYKGAAPATQDMLAGVIPMMFTTTASAATLLASGKVRSLVVTTRKRSPMLPQVPTANELGYPQIEVSVWAGLIAPAGTPPDIVRRLNAEANAALKDAGIVKRLEDLGADPVGGTPQQFAAVMNADVARWTQVIKSGSIKAE
jgi:tripartite-type tricarboxylate transporter receptor subunit TctC